jgi:hypothetical protein
MSARAAQTAAVARSGGLVSNLRTFVKRAEPRQPAQHPLANLCHGARRLCAISRIARIRGLARTLLSE